MVVAVASPSPAAPSPGRLHPTYKEMIMQALTELRDPGGSSRAAIASYIAGHFTGLHARHDSLLNIHLRSLESHGQLRQVSGNYFVSTPPGLKRGRGRPRKNAAPSASVPVFKGPKRGRGRPRKDALHPVASSPSPLQGAGAGAPPPPSGVKRPRGRPRKNALALVPYGGSGVKRGRGRPRKNAPVPVRSSFSQLLGAIAPPPPPGVKRGRGRPRKNTTSPALAPLLGVEQGPAGGQPQSTTPPSLPPAPMPHSGKLKPVRPFRAAVDISALRGSPMSISACSSSVIAENRGQGRPPEVVIAGEEKMQPESMQMTESQQEALTVQAADQAGVVQNEVETRDLQAWSTLTEKTTEYEQEILTIQAADQAGAVQNEVEARDLLSLGTPSMEKRGRGRPRKRPLETKTAEAGDIASTVKRGRGRPRKEKTLESVHSKAAQMTQGQHEALSAQVADQAGAVQNEVEARDLPFLGTLTEKMTEGEQEALTAQAADHAGAMQNEVEARDLQSTTEKRGRGRPIKKPLETGTAEAGDIASVVKRGRGRPRKEKALENGHLKAPQMTEGQHEALSGQVADQAGAVQNDVEARDLLFLGTLTEKMTEGEQEALTAQAADHAGSVQNEVEARDLQSLGTSTTEKRGRGRPRKRPLETKTAEAGDIASTVKRGRGRPTKEKTLEIGDLEVAQMTEGQYDALPAQALHQTGPMQNEVEARNLQSFGTPSMEKRGRGRPRKRPLETGTAETKVAALVIKRGRGRPRKARPFETGSVETAVKVSRDLTEDVPEKDGDIVSGNTAETQGVTSVEGIDAGCLGEEVAIAPMDAGGVLLSGEEAAIGPMDAGHAMPNVDLMDVGTKGH